jgi:hypothetical protein
MSLLPLSCRLRQGDASHMSQPEQRPSGALQQLARKVARIIAECQYAQHRMAVLRMAPDSYLMAPRGAPDTYGEFLFRTSGPLPHEPSAHRRGTGTHPVS